MVKIRLQRQCQLPDNVRGRAAESRFTVDCGVKIRHMAQRLPDVAALAKKMGRNCRSAAGGAVDGVNVDRTDENP
jgi:hypothetical protein